MSHQKPIVLIDIDGTLANIDKRRLILEKPPHNWNEFFSDIGSDSVNKPVAELYKLIWESEKYECIIVSGRPEQYRTITEQWFIWNEIPFDKLFMRSDNDNRADHIIKEEILCELIEGNKNIAFVIDDRQSVVDMWRRNGLTCFQCDSYLG